MNQKYHVILADPPWSYNDKKIASHKDKSVPWTARCNYGAEKHYRCMPISQIQRLNVASLAENNAVLFLWVTMPLLKEGISTMSAWGFKYKTNGFSWVKCNKNGTPFFGVGAYTKSNVELCLMGVRGKVGRLVKGQETDPKIKLSVASNYVSSLITTSRPNKSPVKHLHSSKPDEQYSRIEQLFGEVSRVELFARKIMPGWGAIGYDIDGQEIQDVIGLS